MQTPRSEPTSERVGCVWHHPAPTPTAAGHVFLGNSGVGQSCRRSSVPRPVSGPGATQAGMTLAGYWPKGLLARLHS